MAKGAVTLSAFLLSASLLGAGGVSGNATDHRHHHDEAAQGGDAKAYRHALLESLKLSMPASVEVRLEDQELVTQHGDRVKFASDVIGDRIVVIDFVYTNCTTICPALSAVFSLLQDALGDRLGRQVFLVSLSVDPARDTPERLKAYADKHKARVGWEWLTGDPAAVDKVLHGMGAYVSGAEQQPAMVLVGDGRTGEWICFVGFPGTDQLLAHVDALSAERRVVASDGFPVGK
jgi:cytochrome oxidase Cu insertion factor (SCO1/SenC/PrrC family)